MKFSRRRLLKAERDSILAEAIKRALGAMMLLQGTRVTFGRKAGFLDFEKEILKLTDALRILGLDPPSPVVHESIRRERVGTSLSRRINSARRC
jgi:hypothetical protein